MTPVLFPVYGQGFRFPVSFRDTSGNLITGWTGASATAYPDNGSGTAATIAESPVGSGIGYVDVSTAQMTCSMLTVVSTVTNSNATAAVAAIQTLRLAPFAGRWDAQSPTRFEQIPLDLYSGVGLNGANTDGLTLNLYNPDGTVKFSSSINQVTGSGTRSKTQ